MNREILFKGKRKDNGEWVEGGYFCEPYTDKNLIICWNSFGLGFNEFIEIDPNTLCQYTGLNDKNGQKIWENDILCGRLDEKYPENITYRKVVWDMNGFYTKEDYPTNLDLIDEFDTEHFEVCGNIFDNYELLEV